MGLATIELPKRLFLFRASDERNLHPIGKVTDVFEERKTMMITAELRDDPDVLAGFAEGLAWPPRGRKPVQLAQVWPGVQRGADHRLIVEQIAALNARLHRV